MQAILNPPVPLHQLSKAVCRGDQATDVILAFAKGLVCSCASALDDNQRGQSAPERFERLRGVVDLNPTMHGAATTLLSVVVATPGAALLPSLLNRLVQVRLVSLRTHQIVITPLDDLL